MKKLVIKNKYKFIGRIVEIITILVTLVLTLLSIKIAMNIRGYDAIGGEYLIPLFGLLIIIFIEEFIDNHK